jgi:hypothetical protein
MVRSLQRRVAALEEAASGKGPGGECPECGGPDHFGENDTFEVVFEDATPGESPGENEYCPECGRQTTMVIKFGEEL